MITRAKFQVTKVSEFNSGDKRAEISRLKKHVAAYAKDPDDGSVSPYARDQYEDTGIPMREITLSAVYGDTEENRSFSTSTPSGTINFHLNNPALADEFKPGQTYYVDFTRSA